MTKNTLFYKVFIIILFLGAVVEDVRTIFEQRNDTTIYIPVYQQNI